MERKGGRNWGWRGGPICEILRAWFTQAVYVRRRHWRIWVGQWRDLTYREQTVGRDRETDNPVGRSSQQSRCEREAAWTSSVAMRAGRSWPIWNALEIEETGMQGEGVKDDTQGFVLIKYIYWHREHSVSTTSRGWLLIMISTSCQCPLFGASFLTTPDSVESSEFNFFLRTNQISEILFILLFQQLIIWISWLQCKPQENKDHVYLATSSVPNSEPRWWDMVDKYSLNEAWMV